ncbi:helix-turn-helix domain-containing protein [Aquimarina pacifica]|uniref:helix-turn-helix domain-containing protein n=1 Tax=Aquimarina pacifica TaxID=1296415 RepID=UPI0013789F73|nr:AraC family transcriptional regulator [Aquimarina pacifica]
MCLLLGIKVLMNSTEKKGNLFLGLTFIGLSIVNTIEVVFYFPEVKNTLATNFGGFFYFKETIELSILPLIILYICDGLKVRIKKWVHFILPLMSLFFTGIYLSVLGTNQIGSVICHWYIWTDAINYSFITIQGIQLFYYLFFVTKTLKTSKIESSNILKEFEIALCKFIFFCKFLYLTDFILAVKFKAHLGVQVPIYFTYKILFLVSIFILFLLEVKYSLLAKTIENNFQKYAKSGLTDQYKEQIFSKINEYMDGSQPYLNQSFSLEVMAKDIGVLRTHISRVINEEYKINFREFVNSYRIKESIRLMKEEESNTISQIYFEAGFNSKSVFNTVFKKKTGKTPTEYRKSIYEDSELN